MKLHIMSDLHLDVWGWNAGPAGVFLKAFSTKEAEALILAGDCVNLGTLKTEWTAAWFRRFCEHYPWVLFVPGNHEFYGTDIPTGLRNLADIEKDIPGMATLSAGRIVEISGHRFIGGTLWQPPGDPLDAPINDHYRIKGFRTDAAAQFQETEKFLEDEMKDGDVVVTHHAPTFKSLAPQFRGDDCNRWFITPEVEPLLLSRRPALWVHGHTHTPFDYVLGDTRVVCNPRGYPGERPEAYRPLEVDL